MVEGEVALPRCFPLPPPGAIGATRRHTSPNQVRTSALGGPQFDFERRLVVGDSCCVNTVILVIKGLVLFFQLALSDVAAGSLEVVGLALDWQSLLFL